MFYNVLSVKDLVNLNESKFLNETLLQHASNSLNIIALKKGEIIETHTSVEDVAVYVIEGEIEIHFPAEQYKLKKEELIMFQKNKEHKVLANKTSKFFVIKI